jgi:hypothetical protein
MLTVKIIKNNIVLNSKGKRIIMDQEYVYDRECDDCGAKTCAEVAYFYEDKTFCEDCCPEGYGE